jgi:hypothetical protein
MKNKALHLLDEPPIVLYPTLATMLGVNQALIFQQLHFLLQQAEKDEREFNLVDGQWWIYNTYQEWRKKYFQWLPAPTIKRYFGQLEDLNLVISIQSVKSPLDRRKWYRIAYQKWAEYAETWAKLAPVDRIKLLRSRDQIDPLKGSNCSHDLYTETPTETPTDISPPASPKRRQKDYLYELIMLRSFKAAPKRRFKEVCPGDREINNSRVVGMCRAIRRSFLPEDYRATDPNKLIEKTTIVRELRAAYKWHGRQRKPNGEKLGPPEGMASITNLLRRFRQAKGNPVAASPLSLGGDMPTNDDVMMARMAATANATRDRLLAEMAGARE